jgi:lipopolysaccharide biosynthesis regulator YciM
VRAYIVLGHVEMQQATDAAGEAFERVATLDVDFVPEVLRRCSTATRAAADGARGEILSMRSSARRA